MRGAVEAINGQPEVANSTLIITSWPTMSARLGQPSQKQNFTSTSITGFP